MVSDHDTKENTAFKRTSILDDFDPSLVKRSRTECGRGCWLKEAFDAFDSSKQQVTAYTTPKSRHWEESDLRECARKLYQPLNSWQTRIIELHPGKGTDELRCTFLVVDLIAHRGVGIPARCVTTEYIAMSYSWGKAAVTATIECNGIECGISLTLHEALWYTRSPEIPCYIWCDALVINQYDVDEKASQVKQMLLIFEKSHHVVAWLGSVTAQVSRLFDIIEASSSRPSFGSRIKDIQRSFREENHDEDCIMHLEELRADMNSLVTRPWFHRLWIRQEVFAASYLDFKCGPKSLGYRYLIQWLDKSNPEWRKDATFETLEILSNDVTHAAALDFDYRVFHNSRSDGKLPYVLHWLENLHKGSYFGATDDRDRVYGLLGMIQSPSAQGYVAQSPRPSMASSGEYKEPQSGFDIDYRRPIAQVYGLIIKTLMRQTLSLTPLLVFEDRRHRTSDLPSWVIDWRQCQARHFEERAQVPNTLIKVMALAEDSFEPQKQSGWMSRPDRLVLEGIQIHMDLTDTIEHSDDRISVLFKKDSSTMSHIPRASDRMQTKRHAQAVLTMCELIRTGAYVFRKVLMRGDDKRIMAFVPENATIDDIMVKFNGTHTICLLRVVKNRDPATLGPLYYFVGPIAILPGPEFEQFIEYYEKAANVANFGVRYPLNTTVHKDLFGPVHNYMLG